MALLRNIVCVILIALNGALFTNTSVFGPQEEQLVFGADKPLKAFIITYRIDDGNKRGKAQKATIIAETSSKAKETFRISNSTAVIISCVEKTS